jgi:hypothetical protein
MATQPIRNRQIQGDQSRDPSSVELLTYSEKSGARKSVNLGPALLPLAAAGSNTTNATTPVALPSAGVQLAIYNNSGTVQAVTVGDSTMAPQASGAVQTLGSPTAPFVGVPCMPNAWTYLSSAQWNYVAATSANLLVFLVDDPTYIVAQPVINLASQNNTAPSNT